MPAGNNPARKRRGAQTQSAVAAWFASHGWPFAESAGSARPGIDVTGLPGLACEVKARRDLSLPKWLRQAGGRPGLPFVVHRPDGYGPDKIGQWPVTLRLDTFTKLLHDAGYGDDLPVPGVIRDIETGQGYDAATGVPLARVDDVAIVLDPATLDDSEAQS